MEGPSGPHRAGRGREACCGGVERRQIFRAERPVSICLIPVLAHIGSRASYRSCAREQPSGGINGSCVRRRGAAHGDEIRGVQGSRSARRAIVPTGFPRGDPRMRASGGSPGARKDGLAMDGLAEILTFLPRLIMFLVTYPLRFFGMDFDWGILP